LDRSSLGKLIAVHTSSPLHQQRAAVVAALSFVFFMAMMLVFYARGELGYFLLSTAFLIVFVFTMIGWWMQRRNIVEVFDRGIVHRKHIARWEDITSVEANADGSILIAHGDRNKVRIPGTIDAIGSLETYIRSRILELSEQVRDGH
jgi:hypothetical protein